MAPKKYCPTCGNLVEKRKNRFCSRACAYKDPERRRISSETMRKTNLRRRKILSERMKRNNPARDPRTIEKMKQTKRINGTLHIWPGERGGNGAHTEPQMLLAATLGWEMELPIKLAEHIPKGKKREYTTANGWPTNYKLDIGNRALKIGIEVDGRGHKWKQKKEKDRKKEDALKPLGWKVLHFTNKEIMTNLSMVLLEIRKEIKAL